jgi:outer membrane protein assembly factor BamA
MDHFGRRGVRSYLDYRFNQTHSLRVDVSGHRYEVLQKNSDWSLFGRSKEFPPNVRTAYPALPGEELSIRLSAVLDGRDNPVFPLSGWYADAQFEVTQQDFETEGLFLTLKRYQPTFGDQKFQIKLLAGTRSGSRAFQHLVALGGLGNLRGFREKEFLGDRLLYVNANYIIGQQWLHHVPLNILPFWESISLGVFAETGHAWFADPQNPEAGLFDTGDFELNDLRSDVGLSLYFAENLFRVDFARRTDRSQDNWRVTFRILDKF